MNCCGHPLSYTIKAETRDPNAKGKSHLGLLKQVNHYVFFFFFMCYGRTVWGVKALKALKKSFKKK